MLSPEAELAKLQEEWREEVRRTLADLRHDISTIKSDVATVKISLVQVDRIADHEKRVAALERWQSRIVGMSISGSAVIGILIKLFWPWH